MVHEDADPAGRRPGARRARPGGRAAARAVVSRWFADADTDEAGLDTLIGTLQPGFKKILGVLGSGRLVLTDHPQARGSTLADSEAFVFTQREPLDVVYVEGAFFGSGNLLKGLKNWTRILVHELSHREQKTVDKFYAWQGIKPVVGGFPSADAIVNAESWAFFCADAAGARERLRVLVRTHFDVLLGPDSAFIPVMLYEWRSLTPAQREAVDQLRRDYESAWTPVLEALHASGRLRTEVKLARLLIFGALNWAVQWYDPRRRATLDDLTDTAINLFLKQPA